MVFSMDVVLRGILSVAVLRTEVRAASEGQSRVIGSQQPIVAVLGHDVILPCRLEPSLNAEGLTVEWSKVDRPDHVEYPMVYRGRDELLERRSQSFSGRTALFKKELKHGNISLKVMNVTLEDQGTYRCHIPKLDSQWKDWTVQLDVEPERTTDSPLHFRNLQTSEPPTKVKGGRSHLYSLIPPMLVLLVLFGGYVLRRCRKQRGDMKDQTVCQDGLQVT